MDLNFDPVTGQRRGKKQDEVQIPLLGPISDPAARSIVWRAALGVLVASTSMRPFISLSCSREAAGFAFRSECFLVDEALRPETQ
jgi:hypothetical protein